MYKKALINLTAVTMAMSVAFGVSLTAFAADGDPASVPERFDETWKQTTGDKEVKADYEGDVVTNSGDEAWSTVYADGKNVEVNVTGNVENQSDYWRTVGAINGGEATVNGDVSSPNLTNDNRGAAEAYANSSVTINGNVTSNSNGIKANGVNATITVGDPSGDNSKGNVTAEKTAIIARDQSTIKVYGDATGATGIDMNNYSKVIVEGDVSYTDNGIVIDEKSPISGEKVEILGTLKDTSDSNESAAIVVKPGKDDNSLEIINKLPEIVVYEITDDTNLVSVVTDDDSISKDVEEYIKNHIQYIVKHDEEDNSAIKYFSQNGLRSYTSISDKEVVDLDASVITMTINSAIQVAVQEGYSVTAGDNVTVTDLGNGVYEIRLDNNKGGVYVKAHLIGGRVVAENTETVSDDEPRAESEAPSVPFIFAKFTVSPTGANALPTVLGAYIGEEASNVPVQATKVVKVPAGNLTAIEYKNAFIKTVTEAPKDATVILETAMCSCLDKAMVDALATRPDVSVQIVFPKDKTGAESYSVTIPAGYDVNSLVDANGYCGFMYLNSLFGC
ncbi:Formylmethanofuran dehydrogenase subunit C [Butyrivibrio sp. Su6]|uniref:hypothetical protein n=1 Tax=Butyrivibrio sp. Su6 TaxID=1520810 RepID=UPI00089E98F4|nr:hypothetical protein [Butyrivibrio sp. Su6]SEF51369.1 Formylmethanofuran dehydrogenase subunit C [Butyrivibrio sp. Su6]